MNWEEENGQHQLMACIYPWQEKPVCIAKLIKWGRFYRWSIMDFEEVKEPPRPIPYYSEISGDLKDIEAAKAYVEEEVFNRLDDVIMDRTLIRRMLKGKCNDTIRSD